MVLQNIILLCCLDYACSPALWTPPPFCPPPSASYARYTSAPEPPLLWPATPLPRNPHFCEKLKQQKWKAWERKERKTCQRLIANTAWTLTVVRPPSPVHFIVHLLLMDFGVWTPSPFVVHFLLMDFGVWTPSPSVVHFLLMDFGVWTPSPGCTLLPSCIAHVFLDVL